TASEKVRIVEETFEPGMTVSLVARRHGVAPNQLFTWRRLVVEGALTAAGSGEQVVPASDYRALQSQVRELQRLLSWWRPDCLAEVRVLCERVSLSACLSVETGIFLLNWGAEQVIRP